ncbi:YdiU family protein [Rhodococcus sp. G-MC3]|uniref:protein adenylyltransferase SelO n=1 Tax=Rhodococcus sp. G-MC3 TaxID=3046209 RepID=UPI0024BBE4FF|nr:YdiU family protein [Rhodococcus sp. G-MC3]MDJ0395644.1 YdiU family protein [Rhodococcus sp. G-MC3]
MPAHTPITGLESTFAREVPGLTVPWQGAHAPQPRVVAFNERLARELHLDVEALRSAPEVLSGSTAPEGSSPVAMAYSGHQFGGYAPLLGDGRALLVGELDIDGRRVDLHLKGSGRTPFSRGGDGLAVVGPMLREYLVSEAMHALAIPTTRSLAVTTTGQDVLREGPEPGAVLARVAASHIRVGTFEYAVRQEGLVQPLADYAIARHYPSAEGDYLAFFGAVVEAQASLVAQWMLTGFVHGVMNTDNTTISGQTIDYGPCAFLDAFDRSAVFSSIDHSGRYAFGNQPAVLQWNLARFGETLLSLIGPTPEEAIAPVTAVLDTFFERYERHFNAGMAAKLGLDSVETALVHDLLNIMERGGLDWTGTFRALSRGTSSVDAEWISRWRALGPSFDEMDLVNPLYIPRNHLLDAALKAATAGDLGPFEALLDVVTHPFAQRDEWAEFTRPAPQEFQTGFQTFCGT